VITAWVRWYNTVRLMHRPADAYQQKPKPNTYSHVPQPTG
jgi:hypothetical protein